jgi:hypothetical protein
LGLLGSLEWERYDLNVEGSEAKCDMPQEEIDVVCKWMDTRIANLKRKRDEKASN